MRIRSIKPDFWRSATIAELDWSTRLVLKGLESYVDDNGVGKDDLALIAADVFPRDLSASPRETLARLSEAISALSDHGLIARYVTDGERLLYIDRWKQIQRIDKPTQPRFPRPDGSLEYADAVPRESYARAPEVLAPGSGSGSKAVGSKDSSSPAAPSTDDLSIKRINIDAEFDAWWQLYPRKVSRGAALKAYRSARRKTDAATLTAAIQRQSVTLTAKGSEFCPHGATWLNSERWTDDLAATSGAPRMSQTRTPGILPREY